MKTTNKYLLEISILLILIISLYLYNTITLETVKENKIWISRFVDDNYAFSVFLFFLSCAVFINSPVPFAALLKLLGGFFFGPFLGAIYNIAATLVACLVGFGLSRYAFKEAFEKKYYQHVKDIESKIEKNGFYYFLTLRVVMVVPYFLINISAGISRVSFKDFLLSTLLGVIPSSLIYANGGNKLEQIDSVSDLLTGDVVVSMLLIVCVALLPAYFLKEETS